MAKSAKQDVALKESQAVAESELFDEFDKYEGQGVSHRPEDNLIPLLYMLQVGSPQVQKRDLKYVDGAEAGDILLTNINRIYKGEAGILFQPCYFEIVYNEWIPRDEGGGFRGSHKAIPSDAISRQDPNRPRGRAEWFMPDGNELKETRQHYGFILDPEHGPMQALLSLTSTGHQVSRAWMTYMGSKRTPGSKSAPSWAVRYLLTSVVRQNPGNPDSFTWKFEDQGWVSRDQFELGTRLRTDIIEGAKQAAVPEGNEEDQETPF